MAQTTPSAQLNYRRLGGGACGSVWTSFSKHDPFFGYAFKREDGSSTRSLLKEYNSHCRLLSLLRQLIGILGTAHPDEITTDISSHVFIPYSARLLHPQTREYGAWWEQHKKKFPREYVRCTTAQIERIPTFPREVRNILIDKFCPESLVRRFKRSEANGNCIVRPYLGRRRFFRKSKSPVPVFSLQNFPLHLDRMEKLGIGLDSMARYVMIMAEALAMIHWLAELDGSDIEFVLAPPRRENALSGPLKQGVLVNALGKHVVWLLDFDCCNPIAMDKKGVNQAVLAFLQNDPYYPRPGLDGGILWNVFELKYLETSTRIFRHRRLCGEPLDANLPATFVEKVKRKCMPKAQPRLRN
jgi:hypothetical protein